MYDTDMARRLKSLGKQPARPAWYEAICEQERPQPLIFSIADGNIRAEQGVNLTLTATAAALDWEKGDRAAAILSGGSLLVIDRI